MSVKAIETEYNGYRFRSRLEARWAILFDVIGLKYFYEYEGYEKSFIDGETIRYLPDFYFPNIGLYAEVKGATCRGQIPKSDAEKMSWMIDYDGPCSKGIVMLGDIPEIGNDIEWAIWRYNGEGISWGYEIGFLSGEWGCFNSFDYMSAPHSFKETDDICLTHSLTSYDLNNNWIPNIWTKAFTKARQARFEHGEKPIIKIGGKIYETV